MENNFELPKLNNNENKSLNNQEPTLKKTFENVIHFLTKANISEIMKFILELLIFVVIIILFKLPFDLIIDLGPNLFSLFGINVTDVAVNVWNFLFNFLYTILAIVYYLKIFKERFFNIQEKYHKNTSL